LRHLIPFAEVEKSIEYLGELNGRVAAVTVADDGEKFGGWPGTFKHVYEDGWLDAFFDRGAETPWLRWATFADVVDTQPASGRVYLPTASYQEMGEWALPTEAGACWRWPSAISVRSRAARAWSACCAAASGGTSW
jgi:alpha-amylase